MEKYKYIQFILIQCFIRTGISQETSGKKKELQKES